MSDISENTPFHSRYNVNVEIIYNIWSTRTLAQMAARRAVLPTSITPDNLPTLYPAVTSKVMYALPLAGEKYPGDYTLVKCAYKNIAAQTYKKMNEYQKRMLFSAGNILHLSAIAADMAIALFPFEKGENHWSSAYINQFNQKRGTYIDDDISRFYATGHREHDRQTTIKLPELFHKNAFYDRYYNDAPAQRKPVPPTLSGINLDTIVGGGIIFSRLADKDTKTRIYSDRYMQTLTLNVGKMTPV